MNIQQLRYVVATAQHGSMTAAATALFVAQPALSRAVRQLERELGVTLFARSGRRVRLTPTGDEFVTRARRVLDSIDALRGPVGDRGSDALVIAASPTMQTAMALPLLGTLREQGVTMSTRLVGCGASSEVLDVVASGRAHLGICDQDLPTSLARLPVGSAEVRLYSPASVDLPERVTAADLAGVPLVVPTRGSKRRDAIEALFAGVGLEPTIAIETDQRNAWLGAVRHGLASCIWHSVESFGVPLDGIVARGFEPAIHQRFVVVHRGEDGPVEVVELIRMLHDLAGLRAG